MIKISMFSRFLTLCVIKKIIQNNKISPYALSKYSYRTIKMCRYLCRHILLFRKERLTEYSQLRFLKSILSCFDSFSAIKTKHTKYIIPFVFDFQSRSLGQKCDFTQMLEFFPCFYKNVPVSKKRITGK